MSNGRDLIEMVCQSYESPEDGEPGITDDEEDEEEQELFNFSEALGCMTVCMDACHAACAGQW